MNFAQAQETFNTMFPDKNKEYGFDEKCVHKMDAMFTDGNPHLAHYVEYNKVKVIIEGLPELYIPLMPFHRVMATWKFLKEKISTKEDVFINPEQMKLLVEAKLNPEKQNLYEDMIKEAVDCSGLPREKIEQKLVTPPVS